MTILSAIVRDHALECACNTHYSGWSQLPAPTREAFRDQMRITISAYMAASQGDTDAPKHSDFELATQMNADYDRIKNQRGTFAAMLAASLDFPAPAGRTHVANWIDGPSAHAFVSVADCAEARIAELSNENGDNPDDYTVTALYADVYSDPNTDTGAMERLGYHGAEFARCPDSSGDFVYQDPRMHAAILAWNAAHASISESGLIEALEEASDMLDRFDLLSTRQPYNYRPLIKTELRVFALKFADAKAKASE